MTEDWFDKEIESWEGFHSGLRRPDYDLFKQMLENTNVYREAIKRKEKIPTEALLMALILEQQKMITSLLEKYQIKS